MRNDMLADNVFINSGAGSICLLKVLNDGIVNYVTSFVDKFRIMFLSGADDDISSGKNLTCFDCLWCLWLSLGAFGWIQKSGKMLENLKNI